MIIWTRNSINDINDFIKEARFDTKITAIKYISRLTSYSNILESMSNIGKNLHKKIKGYEMRQLIYRKHRIIYTIKNDNIYIVAVVHTRLDLKKALNKLNKGRN